MIVAFIAIAGLLLSNKDDVVSFINKHNINWFERNLVNTQINKQHNKGTIHHSVSDALKSASSSSSSSNSNSNKLIAFGNEVNDNKNAIHLMDDPLVSEAPIRVPSKQPALPSPPAAVPAVAATVIAITNPPIISEEITTQYAPAWKNLINKIVNSNKNEPVAVNSVGIVDKARSTVASAQLLKATTDATPTKTTTLAPVQHESSKFSSTLIPIFSFQSKLYCGNYVKHRSFMPSTEKKREKKIIEFFMVLVSIALESVRNEMLEKKSRLQNEEPNKANNKLPNAIKPYWYIDPSIVYRAMTSPVTT